MIRDSDPKPAQTAALVVEIHKLVWLNAHRFYSGLNKEKQLHTEKENQLLSVIYDTLGGVAGIIGWISLVSLTALVVCNRGNDEMLNFGAKFVVIVLFMVYLRHVVSPDVAIPLNLALITSLATIFTRNCRVIEDFKFSNSSSGPHSSKTSGDLKANKVDLLKVFIVSMWSFIVFISIPLILGSSLVFGTIISVRSWSDVLIACHAAPGVSVGAYAFILHNEKKGCESPVFVPGSFLCCTIGATLSMGFVTVFALLGVKMTMMLLILGLTLAYWHLKSETLQELIGFTILTLFLPCGCVLILGSVFLILGLMMSFLKVLIESLVSSYLFYVGLFLGALIIWRKNSDNTTTK